MPAEKQHKSDNSASVPIFAGRGPGHGPRHAAMAAGPKPKVKDARKTILRFGAYLRPFLPRLTAVFILVIIASAQSMLGPYLISRAIDGPILSGDFPGLLRISLIMLGLYVITAAANGLMQIIMIGVSQPALRNLRRDLFRHIQSLDLAFFDSRPRGEIISRMTNDVENISNVLSQSITQFFTSILSLTGVLIMMFLMNVPLAFITLATIPLSFLITGFIGRYSRENFRKRQRHLGEINAHIEETVTAQRIIKLYGKEADMEETLAISNRQLKGASIRAQVLGGLMGPLMNMTNNLRYLIVAAAGGILGIREILTIGVIAAFLNYTRQFGRPLNQLAQLYNSILSALAGAERIFEVLDEKARVVDDPAPLTIGKTRGHVVFDQVNFSYIPDTPVLKDITLEAQPGQTVALVGPTGAGKTTIINLLSRFYDIDSGTILLDGKDIRRLKRSELRGSLGLVLQDTFLFSASVRENIRYGRPDATDEEVRRAAETACADHFIHHLPEGYETRLSEDASNLSQGQRQLLAIARAVLLDPSILILDEATSSVDTRTEKLIQEGMTRLRQGRTSFVIAHRLSTIRDADLIAVIEDGRIEEQGTHQSLLTAEGVYAQFHRSRFETSLN